MGFSHFGVVGKAFGHGEGIQGMQFVPFGSGHDDAGSHWLVLGPGHEVEVGLVDVPAPCGSGATGLQNCGDDLRHELLGHAAQQDAPLQAEPFEMLAVLAAEHSLGFFGSGFAVGFKVLIHRLLLGVHFLAAGHG